MTPNFSTPSRDEWLKFLLGLYFGQGMDDGNLLKHSIERAYYDFCRTIHGLGKLGKDHETETNALYSDACQLIENAIVALGTENIRSQTEFDQWHDNACNSLKSKYNDFFKKHKDSAEFTIGQSQKWINMTLKYAFALIKVYPNPIKIEYLNEVYAFCHAPIDNIFLETIGERFGKEILKDSFCDITGGWSRKDNYAEYSQFQRILREAGQAPLLDVEFSLWNKGKITA